MCHLCCVQVPFFEQMDAYLLDAICERLVSSLNTKDTLLIREGDPVKEMFFIIRGRAESSSIYGGRSGYFNTITLKAGDFFGEELLTWGLSPASSNLPPSTRTVKTLTELEAFALRAEDVKLFCMQFKRQHTSKIRHAFRYYSLKWRIWGASYIQAAWRRYVNRKLAMELLERENMLELDGEEYASSVDSSTGKTILVGSLSSHLLAKNTKKPKVTIPDENSLLMPGLFKPTDPDFSVD